MSDPKPDFAAAYVDVRYSASGELILLAFFDADARIPHIVTLPKERLDHLEVQILHKLREQQQHVPRA